MMWKIVFFGILSLALVAEAKIVPGKIIGPIAEDPSGEWPLFGSYFTNKYAKIAREIVHNSSEFFFLSQNLTHFFSLFIKYQEI